MKWDSLMKLTAPYKCDYCDRTKTETNHWWLRSVGVSHTVQDSFFFLIRWDDAKARADDHEHICSEACAVKALAKFMGASA